MASIVIKRYVNDTKDYHVIEINGPSGNVLATRYGKVGVAGRFDAKAYALGANGYAGMMSESRKVGAKRTKNGYVVGEKKELTSANLESALELASQELGAETFGKVREHIEKCFSGESVLTDLAPRTKPVSTEEVMAESSEHYGEEVWGTW